MDGEPVGEILGAEGANIRRFRDAVWRCLGAEVSEFIRQPNLESERWQPYLRWARELLAPGDTVLTFNYDLVPQVLSQWLLQQDAPPLEVPHFAEVTNPLDTAHTPPLVLKLHGCVSWGKKPAASPIEWHKPHALWCGNDDLYLATPGPTKRKMTHGEGALRPLWNEAERRMQQADAVVFIGYRFPPSDAQSRQELLGWLDRARRQRKIRTHVVLGAGRDADVIRMEGLIEAVMRRPASCVWPMYGEDFLSVAQRGTLLVP